MLKLTKKKKKPTNFVFGLKISKGIFVVNRKKI